MNIDTHQGKEGINKINIGTQKARSRRTAGTLGWYTTLSLFTIALSLIAGCPDSPSTQIDITAPEPVAISSSNMEIMSSSITVQWWHTPRCASLRGRMPRSLRCATTIRGRFCITKNAKERSGSGGIQLYKNLLPVA